MNRILTIAGTEFRIARRNRWVTVSALMMMIFAFVLTAAGSAPSGALAADRLSVVVASLTSLAVYVVPLIALLLSFDAVAGEVERGTLPLLLTYPVSRAEALAGKLLAHLGVLALALLAGYGLAAVVAIIGDRSALAGLPALWRLGWSSILLGITFLGAGYALSSVAGRPSGAAGLAIALWVVMVVLYDLGLLAMVVADDGGRLNVNAAGNHNHRDKQRNDADADVVDDAVHNGLRTQELRVGRAEHHKFQNQEDHQKHFPVLKNLFQHVLHAFAPPS